MQNDTSRSDR